MVVNMCDINGKEYVIVSREYYEELLRRVDELNHDIATAQKKARHNMERAKHLANEVDSFIAGARTHLKQGMDMLAAISSLCDK